MKRSFDFMVSLAGLIILIPVFLLISILIKTTDKGPVFFRQLRVGRGGKLFVLYKFRSMSPLKSAENGSFEPGDSSRVTTIGKFLRKTKIDELPQLFNVLKGDMSLVGPRPEVEKWVRVYPEKWEKVLTVRPGITDYASIYYRNEETMMASSADPEREYREIILPRKLELYEKYVIKHTFLNDIKLICITIFHLF